MQRSGALSKPKHKISKKIIAKRFIFSQTKLYLENLLYFGKVSNLIYYQNLSATWYNFQPQAQKLEKFISKNHIFFLKKNSYILGWILTNCKIIYTFLYPRMTADSGGKKFLMPLDDC